MLRFLEVLITGSLGEMALKRRLLTEGGEAHYVIGHQRQDPKL